MLLHCSVGRRSFAHITYSKNIHINEYYTTILNNACQSPLIMALANLDVTSTQNCCTNSYKQKFLKSTDEIIQGTFECKLQWHKERKFRITGSRLYEIYTYKGMDWKQNKDIFFPKKIY